MKRSTLKLFLSMAAVLGLVASAQADLWTFDTAHATSGFGWDGIQGGDFTGGQYAWNSTLQAVNATSSAGGWTVGGSSPKWEFNWPSQTVMAQYANWANGWGNVSFDVSFDGANAFFWNNPSSGWYQFIVAGNNDGSSGWSQTQVAAGNYDGIGSAVTTYHVSMTFAQLGFQPGDSWFQMFFGSNSDALNGVPLSIDNISVVPEPGTFALAGLGAAALLIIRRRK